VFKHTFANVGEMEVFAKVRDSLGGESVESVPAKVTIVNRAPSVTVAVDKPTGYRGETFTFTASGSDPDGDALVYSFNGGAFGASNVFRTSFSAVGNQTVSVVTRDALGAASPAASTSVNIINRAPTVALAVSAAEAAVGQTVTFTASATDPEGDGLQYSFNLDGFWTAFGSSTTIQTSYSTVGSKSVSVIARDIWGATSNTAAASVSVIHMVNLTVQTNPSEYGVPGGSGSYKSGTTASAFITPHYGYVFKNWQGGLGNAALMAANKQLSTAQARASSQQVLADPRLRMRAQSEIFSAQRAVDSAMSIIPPNPLTLTMDADMTVIGNLDRQLFQVTLKLYANVNSTDDNFWARARAEIRTSSGALLLDKYVTDYGSGTASGSLQLWVPYGDTITVKAWGNTNTPHINAAWVNSAGTTVESKYRGSTGPSYLTQQSFTVSGNLDLGTIRATTPLLLDLSGDGVPDLLAGSNWRKGEDRRPSTDRSNFRLFDLDGTGAKRWEWVGPKDALLVYLEGLKGTPDSKALFGTNTFGKAWTHGYQPLQTLDKDGNGSLEGDELSVIGLWVDGNGDAEAQDGEIVPASQTGLTSLSVGFSEDSQGNVSNNKGAVVNGKELAIWDWISYAYPELNASNEVARLDWSNRAPSSEYFQVEAGEGMEKIDMLPSGSLRVYRINNQLYVRATAFLDEKSEKVVDVLYPAEATETGVLQWGIDGLSNQLVASGTELYGLTLEGKSYGVWTAELVSGDLAQLFR